MAAGLISVTLTFTFINPQVPPLLNPETHTLNVPWVDHLVPIRASMISVGDEFTGYGTSTRHGIGMNAFGFVDLGSVKIHFNDGLGLLAYVDCATAPIFLLQYVFPFVAGFASSLADLSRTVNGPSGEVDLPP